MEYLRIPKERVGVLIGRGGETKRRIERELGVKLEVDSEGTVRITPSEDNPLSGWVARNVVRAIARGINPEKALKLADESYVLEVIDLSEYLRTPKAITRQKARLIGSRGRTRRYIESTTGVTMSVYGKSVALLGEHEEVAAAREAVIMLIQGKPHSVVYRYLDEKARELKQLRAASLWKRQW